MHLEIPHKTSQQVAIANVKKALDENRTQLLASAQIHEERWEGDTLHFDATAQGQRVSGTVLVEKDKYVIDAKLPLMLRLFEGRIERELAERVKELG